MTEQVFDLQLIDHVGFFGVQDRNLNVLRALYPKLKLVVRGDMLKAIGDNDEIEAFSLRFQFILKHFEVYGSLTKKDIEELVLDEIKELDSISKVADDIIVYGRNGKAIKARTENQQKMVNEIASKDMMFAVGPAGTGKTYTAVALAVRALKEKSVKRIVLTRPAVEAGENLGFLPGDLRDKLDPYLQPLYDALRDMLPHQKLLSYFEDSTIEIAPLAFMRGRTLNNAFVILDEAQNCTSAQMKMFLTRMGHQSKFVITGDITQIDLPKNQNSGLIHAVKIFDEVKDISIVMLGAKDIIRHSLVTKIIKAYDDENKNS